MLQYYYGYDMLFQARRVIYIKRDILLNLFSNNELIINEKITGNLENNVLNYVDNTNINNVIDFDNKIFKRENNEFIMTIDFNTKTFNYLLKEKNIEVNDNINCDFIIDNDVTLEYNIGDDYKKIVIKLL